MKNNLGKWSIIDIETTGIDPTYDEIIDIGFYQFNGTVLENKFNSLVKTDVKISQFIQKLTGISGKLLKNAPSIEKVLDDLLELEGHNLIAHNASFEKSFLEKYFDKLGADRQKESFHDSLYFFSLIFPHRSTLNLESILIDLGLAQKEEHRALADSRDLLKAMLLSCYIVISDLELKAYLNDIVDDFSSDDFWFKNFLTLNKTELNELASAVDLDLAEAYKTYQQIEKDKEDLIFGVEKADVIEFSGKHIQEILRDEDHLKSKLDSYRYRESQEQLSLRVGQAFQNNVHALIQAPTGTGKTLGYLLPSVLFAKTKSKPVMISTGTKALQNQAMSKDIPLVHKVLGLSKEQLKVVRLIGSKNHFCQLLFRNEQTDKDSMLDLRDFDQQFTDAYFEMLFFSNERQHDYSKIITAENLPFILKKKISHFADKEKELRVDYKACTGHKCPFKDNCTYFQGLRLSKEADIIIGNHSLLLSWPRSIERPEYIVVDEAHKLETEATQTYTSEVTKYDLENLAKNMSSMVAPLYYLLGEEGERSVKHIKKEIGFSAKTLEENIFALEELIERYAKNLPRYTDIYWNEFPMIKKSKMNNSLEVSIYNHIDSLRYVFKGVYDLITPYVGRWNINSLEDENQITAFTLFESFASFIDEVYHTFENLLEEIESRAGSIKFHEEHGYLLSSAPINVGEIFYEQVLKSSESVVFTSATLANHDGTKGMAQIEWMTGHNLLEPEKRFRTGLFLNNKFNYSQNAKVFLVDSTPSLYDQSFVEHVLDEIIPLIKKLKGRSLLLFSAKVRFEKACEILLAKLNEEIPIHIQGLGKNVVDEFKTTGGVLVGMESFGEGIDIPGKTLEFVYIDKVPDLRQDIVIQKRRDFYDANFGNEFADYFLAHRTRSLHQKLGRLLRRESDRGCAIVTDSRLARWKGRTIDTFRQMMLPYEFEKCSLNDACEKVESFLCDDNNGALENFASDDTLSKPVEHP